MIISIYIKEISSPLFVSFHFIASEKEANERDKKKQNRGGKKREKEPTAEEKREREKKIKKSRQGEK